MTKLKETAIKDVLPEEYMDSSDLEYLRIEKGSDCCNCLNKSITKKQNDILKDIEDEKNAILNTELPDANECCEIDVEKVTEAIANKLDIGERSVEDRAFDITLAQAIAKAGIIKWRKK